MKVYTARQPILNGNKKVVAYELLFRDGPNNAFPAIESNSATAKLLLDSHFNQGLDKITGGKPALINYPEEALLQQVPTLIPNDKAFVEILESVRPTKAVYLACKRLYQQGYKLVLDDFKYSEQWQPFLKMVKLIKFDLADTSFEEIKQVLPKLSGYPNLRFLAEKIETEQQFKQAKQLGIHYFQGYYFSKPQIIEQNDVESDRKHVLAMYQASLNPKTTLAQLAEFFNRDTALTYKLFKFINSGLFPLDDPISSVNQALAYLGQENINKFVNLLITAHSASKQTEQLEQSSILRARFSELLAHDVAEKLSDEAFLTGLFSQLDIILDMPMFEITKELPLSESVASALIGHENNLGNILNVVKSYESGSWSAMRRACARFNINQDSLGDYYNDSVVWANLLSEEQNLLNDN